jgi:hypothetical protein
VNFISSDNHVHEYMFDGAWHDKDLTIAAGVPAQGVSIPLSPLPGALTGFMSQWNTQQHVDFIAQNGHMGEFIY